MSQPQSPEPIAQTVPESASQPVGDSSAPAAAPPSYVKLAMRNMVRKRGKAIYHFVLTTLGMLGFFIGLAYLTR